jgi:Zn-ribbon RNA-binding protein
MGTVEPCLYIHEYVSASNETMDKEKICSSCGVRLIGGGISFFKCPNCGAAEIGRCRQCRDQSVTYVCPNCGFKGP